MTNSAKRMCDIVTEPVKIRADQRDGLNEIRVGQRDGHGQSQDEF